jgi:hypothetical protein
MGFFSFVRDERLVAIGFGVAAVSCIAGMRIILRHCLDEAEIKPTQPKTQYITQDTEDSLKLSTLNNLLQHYNFAIRDTALRIVAGRAVNDDSAVDDLLWGITREDYDERTQSLSALLFAVEDSTNPVSCLHDLHSLICSTEDSWHDSLVGVLNTPKGYSAIVRSLELSLDDVQHEKLDDPLYDEYLLRDVGERRCLILVTLLVHKFGVEKLVEAKFIEKWLAKQPWGDTEEERRKNFALYMDRKKNRISDICLHLKTSKAGRRALVTAKLATKLKKPKRDRSSNTEVVMEITLGPNGMMVTRPDGITLESSYDTELVPRVNDQSVEEQRLRRRHREAMVLNDGTHSLGRGDIIERDHDLNT